MSGLFDHIGPSVIAEDLTRVVRRVRKHTGLDVVPMLVVEGPTDETLLSRHCAQGQEQVFAAGTRGLVEQLLVHLRAAPITGCTCVFLTDCDGEGKTAYLKNEAALVVTENCDSEADLVALGVATEVITKLLGDGDRARGIVEEAIQIAMPVSRVRRAAARASVSFKRSGGARLALRDVDISDVRAQAASHSAADAAIRAVCGKLGWTTDDVTAVENELGSVSNEYRRVCSGKDVLDAAWTLLTDEAGLASMTAEAFHGRVRAGLQSAHVSSWKVGRRLSDWQESVGVKLISV